MLFLGSGFANPDSIISASRLDLIVALKPARKPKEWYEIKADELIQAASDSVPDTLGCSSNISNLKNYIELLKHQQSISMLTSCSEVATDETPFKKVGHQPNFIL